VSGWDCANCQHCQKRLKFIAEKPAVALHRPTYQEKPNAATVNCHKECHAQSALPNEFKSKVET
jgi:hypothetical protein